MKGFVLLELLLAVALLAIMGGFSAVVFQSYLTQDEIEIATETIWQSLRRAQVLSQASQGDSSWGVYIQAGSITIFKGTAWSGHDDSFDEVFDMKGVTPSGVTEVVFAKLTGEPTNPGVMVGDIVLTSGTKSSTITVNEKGFASY